MTRSLPITFRQRNGETSTINNLMTVHATEQQAPEQKNCSEEFDNQFGTNDKNTNAKSDNHSNERTFLAWVRTAITVAAFGLAAAKLAPGLGGTLMGVGMVAVGGFIMVCAGLRFFEVNESLSRGNFRVSHGVAFVLIVSMLLVSLGCIVGVLMLRFP
jgi:putative membrane protein